jgi:hypothetical protein
MKQKQQSQNQYSKTRENRVAVALRENLRRRKVQQQAKIMKNNQKEQG